MRPYEPPRDTPLYERPLVADLVRRLSDGSDLIVAIFGPRQSGKTTAIHQALRRCEIPAAYHGLDTGEDPRKKDESGHRWRPRDPGWIMERWRDARREARRLGHWVILVLDEVHRIEGWSAAVKALWDADRRHGDRVRAVLLGSSPMQMRVGLTESLAGRFEPFPMAHWSFGEMSAGFGFDFDEYLYYGGYPRANRYRGQPGRWADFVLTTLVHTAVERDVLAQTRVDKPALLLRLLRVGSQLAGQMVSLRTLRGHLDDAENLTTLAHYLSLVERIGLLTGLRKFARQEHRRRGDAPKLIALNPALVTAHSERDFPTALGDSVLRGRLVENAVGAHLFLTKTPRMEVLYWREGDSEVDFVIPRGERLYAIEVKSGSRASATPGLEVFARRFPEAVPVVVGGPRGEPLTEVLSTPVPEWLDAH